MDIPEDLRYTSDHEWARQEGDRVRIGITDFAQQALGDIVFVELPVLGNEVESGAVLGEIESTKSVSEVYAPVSGHVVEVNSALAEHPEELNADPYGEAWLCVLEVTSSDAVGELLDAEHYRSLTSD